MNDALGDRMKLYEGTYAQQRFLPGLPIVARIDGRGFSKFTRGMNRPFDQTMSDAMIHTTKELVKHTQASVGYTQSDEITLIWYSDDFKSKVWFDGRVQKMTSLLGAHATLYFNQFVNKHMPQYAKRNPTFDARVWNVPTLQEALNVLIWREWDATKNSIQMAGHNYFSNKQLHKKNTSEIQEMLWSQHNVNWNDYPRFFKRGTYVGWQVMSGDRQLTEAEIKLLPPKHNARKTGGYISKETRALVEFDIPPLTQVVGAIDLFFNRSEK
jgi:tRNA(His) 5'-end guanylyltransferase